MACVNVRMYCLYRREVSRVLILIEFESLDRDLLDSPHQMVVIVVNKSAFCGNLKFLPGGVSKCELHSLLHSHAFVGQR